MKTAVCISVHRHSLALPGQAADLSPLRKGEGVVLVVKVADINDPVRYHGREFHDVAGGAVPHKSTGCSVQRVDRRRRMKTGTSGATPAKPGSPSCYRTTGRPPKPDPQTLPIAGYWALNLTTFARIPDGTPRLTIRGNFRIMLEALGFSWPVRTKTILDWIGAAAVGPTKTP